MKINKIYFRYLAYAIEIILLYVLQNSPNLMPELFGSKPLLLVAAAITISSFETTPTSTVIAAVCGILTDLGSGYIGWFAVCLTIICFVQSEFLHRFFVPTFFTAEIYALAAIITLVWLYFVVFVLLSGTLNSGYLFVHRYISRVVYSFAATIPLYFLNRFLKNNLKGGGKNKG